MSKAVNGNYGTFESDGIRDAVKDYCRKRRIDQKRFFSDNLKLHNSQWWFAICRNGYGDEIELRNVCRAINYDFDKLNFKEGATNDRIERDKAAARKRHHKNEKTKEVEYQQMNLEFKESVKADMSDDFEERLNAMEDHDLIKLLGSFKRVKEIYLLAFYEKEKGLLK